MKEINKRKTKYRGQRWKMKEKIRKNDIKRGSFLYVYSLYDLCYIDVYVMINSKNEA